MFTRRDGGTTLTSTRALDLDGRIAVLRIVEDVSAEAEREHLTQGLSPLDQLSRRLAAMSSDNLELERLDPDAQPRELKPIVASFNALLGRLAGSWQRQRIFVDGGAMSCEHRSA